MGHGRILLSVDLARSQLFSSICGLGGLLSGLLPQESHQKRSFKGDRWGRVKGQTELRLNLGPRGMASPICCLSIQPLRGLT